MFARFSRILLLGLALAALSTGPLQAQTNDHYYRSWRWTEESGAPRPAGMGGAGVALLGDVSAQVVNPATIADLSKSEIYGATQVRSSGTVLGDEASSTTTIGFLGGAGRLSDAWAIGGYLATPNTLKLTLANTPLADGSIDAGYMDGTVTEFGGAVAWSPTEQVHLGVQVSGTHLKLEGEWSRTNPEGVNDLLVGTSSGSTRVIGSVGAIFAASEEFRLGVMGKTGSSYESDRRALDLSGTSDGGVDELLYDLRKPARIIGGFSWQASPKFLIVGQVDYVLYGQVQSNLGIVQGVADRSEYMLDSAAEPRFGIEYSHPFSTISVQLRAGVHSEAPGSLAYAGPNLAETTFVGSERTTHGTAGLSIVARNFKLEASGKFGGDRNTITASAGIRF